MNSRKDGCSDEMKQTGNHFSYISFFRISVQGFALFNSTVSCHNRSCTKPLSNHGVEDKHKAEIIQVTMKRSRSMEENIFNIGL